MGLPTDPIPGDGAGITILAGEQRDRADTVDHARNKVISLLSNESLMGWIGASGKAFWDAAEPFPSQLALLHDSYTALLQAFDTYASAVSSAQSRADVARYRAQSAWHALGLDPGPLDLDTNAFRSHVGRLISIKGLEDAHPDAFSTLSQARTEVDEAITDFDRATQKCVTAIEQAADNAARAIRITGGVSFDDRFRSLNGNPADLIFVAHDGPGLDSASAAKRDAEWLRQALADPDDPWSKALLDLVGQDLAAHSTDTDFLQAFFANGGAQDVADVSRLLAPPGGPTLSQDTKNMLPVRRCYGCGQLVRRRGLGQVAGRRLRPA